MAGSRVEGTVYYHLTEKTPAGPTFRTRQSQSVTLARRAAAVLRKSRRMPVASAPGSFWFFVPDSWSFTSSFGGSRSAVDHALGTLGVAVSLDHDSRERPIDFLQVAGRKRHVHRAQVFLQAVELLGTGDGDDPRLS